VHPADDDLSERALHHALATVPPAILRGTALEDHLEWSMDPQNAPFELDEPVFEGVPEEILEARTSRMPIQRAVQEEAVRRAAKAAADASDGGQGSGIVVHGLQVNDEEEDDEDESAGKGEGETIDGRQCEVCQCEYEAEDEVMVLPCSHFFHICCVDRWLKLKTTCPKCRHEISPPAPSQEREVIITRTTTIEWVPVTQWVPASATTVERRETVGSGFETVTTTTRRPRQFPPTAPAPPGVAHEAAPAPGLARSQEFQAGIRLRVDRAARGEPDPHARAAAHAPPARSASAGAGDEAEAPPPLPTAAAQEGAPPPAPHSGPAAPLAEMSAADYERLVQRDSAAVAALQDSAQGVPGAAPAAGPGPARRLAALTEDEYQRILARDTSTAVSFAERDALPAPPRDLQIIMEVVREPSPDAHPGPRPPALLHFESPAPAPHRREGSWGSCPVAWQPVSPPLGPVMGRSPTVLPSGMASPRWQREQALFYAEAPLGMPASMPPISPPLMPGGPTFLVPAMDFEQFSPRRYAF